MCARSDKVTFERNGGGGEKTSMVGVFLGPCRNGNFTALCEEQGTAFGVKGPVALTGHSPTVVQRTGAHAVHQFVEFTGQALLFPQAGEVAGVVDQHPAVDGHGATDGHVVRQRSDHSGKIPCQQSFDRIGARLESLTVCLMDKGFRYNFSQCSKAADGVGRRNVANLLFSFEGFEGEFGLVATQHHAFLVAVAEVANHPPCTDKSVAVGRFASAREGRDHAVSKRLEYAFLERNGFIHGLSIGQFKHGVHLQFMGCGQLMTQPVDAVTPASDVGNPSGQHQDAIGRDDVDAGRGGAFDPHFLQLAQVAPLRRIKGSNGQVNCSLGRGELALCSNAGKQPSSVIDGGGLFHPVDAEKFSQQAL